MNTRKTVVRAICYFIETFLWLYDKIVPFDAKKGRNGKTHRYILRVLLVAYFMTLAITREKYTTIYFGIVWVSSCILVLLVVTSYRRYQREEEQRILQQVEQMKTQEPPAQPRKKKKHKKHRKKESSSFTSQTPIGNNSDTDDRPDNYDDDFVDIDEEDEVGISDSANSDANSQHSGTADDDDDSPWDDFAIGDALYGLPFNPNKHR